MPKIFIYKGIWIFVIYDTDIYQNRMHVHIGKKSHTQLCKIWLEPNVEIAKSGELSSKELKEVLAIAQDYKETLISQWKNFIYGIPIEIIKIK